MKPDFTPKIIVFACNWCSYGGADLAGVGRLQYPPSIRLIRVMCSGMVAPSYVLKAFERGADGVLITGCHIGDCHYNEGNYKALKVIEKTQRFPSSFSASKMVGSEGNGYQHRKARVLRSGDDRIHGTNSTTRTESTCERGLAITWVN